MHWIVAHWPALLWSIGYAAAAVVGGLIIHRVVFATLDRLAHRTASALDDAIARQLRAPARAIVPLVGLQLVESYLRVPPGAHTVFGRLLTLGLIAAVAWLVARIIAVAETAIITRHGDATADPAVRQITTQMHILRRVLVGIVGIVAVALMLLTFPRVRALGASLLASAGVIALVAGVAVRPAVANLMAGIHIAVTRPIKLEDVVIVEGEWGRIEEITFTYVVVRIWDLRRLVLPISYFTEKPFQNWTRGSPEILGTVFLHADYRVPVEEVRQELQRILQGTPRWDGKTWGLQVTDATERTVQLRALMSAADASTAWDLRCEVREKLLAYLQRDQPESLPRRRTEAVTPPPGPTAAA